MTLLLERPTILAAGKPPLTNETFADSPAESTETEAGADEEEEV